MSNSTTTTSTGLFAKAAAPAAATAAITPPEVLLNALRMLSSNGYPGIFTNDEFAPEAKASFHLTLVDKVVVVAPSIKGTVSQLALASAALGMAAAVGGATLAYNTSFARGRNGGDEGIIPGVYGLVLLAGEKTAVDALARRIAEDHDAGAANARRRAAAVATPVATATPVAAAASNEL
jgi:hypothetical protein